MYSFKCGSFDFENDVFIGGELGVFFLKCETVFFSHHWGGNDNGATKCMGEAVLLRGLTVFFLGHI